MADALQVFWGEGPDPIGLLIRDGEGTHFRYHRGTPADRRISHSLPVEPDVDFPAVFFDNLLPDGIQRERLARRLGVSDGSTFAMLEAIGGDCAGALSIQREGAERTTEPSRPLGDDLLMQMVRDGVVPTSIDEGLRLSLAGAQDKIPVRIGEDVDSDGDENGLPALRLPAGTTPSTHILKFPNRDFKGLCTNEHAMLALAQAVGLPAPRSHLLPLPNGDRALLVTRFDREDGRRLHQEDMLQALGLPPSRKYEADGGPSLVIIADLIGESSTQPDDVLALVRWQAFNIAIGNCDGHAKNISLLREPQVRLAPAYDLVCTRAWPRLDKRLAFGVAGVRDGGAVTRQAWHRFAEAAHLSKVAVVREVMQLTTRAREEMSPLVERLSDEGADVAALKRCAAEVESATRTALKRLEATSQGTTS